MQRRAKQSGFSLLELLMVIAVFAVVMTLGSKIFIQMGDVWGQTEDRVDLEDQAVGAFAAMRADFDQIIPSSISDAVISSTEAEAETSLYRVTLADDEFILPVYTWSSVQNRMASARVQYKVERRGTSSRLVRTTGDLYGDSVEGNLQSVADNVAGFDVQFVGPGDTVWLDNWTGPGFPKAVRVSLLMEGSSLADSRVARVAVMNIHVE
jgi:type II secretion system protein J